MLRHSIEKSSTKVTVNDFKMIGGNYRNNIRKKAAEALLIKQLLTEIEYPRTVSCFKIFKLI